MCSVPYLSHIVSSNGEAARMGVRVDQGMGIQGNCIRTEQRTLTFCCVGYMGKSSIIIITDAHNSMMTAYNKYIRSKRLSFHCCVRRQMVHTSW